MLKQIIEALLFASQKPLSTREMVAALRSAAEMDPENEGMAALAKTKSNEIEQIIVALSAEYVELERGFRVVESASGWQVVSAPDLAVWVRQLFPEARPARLSGPAMETLAIIAYRQPITRADIEAVRGVGVDGVMQTLLDRALVKIAGRADIPGKPLLYETTHNFLEHFGLKTLDELPNSSELRQIKLPTAAPPKPTNEGELALDAQPSKTPAPEAVKPAEPEPAHEEAQLDEPINDTSEPSDADATPEEQPEPTGPKEL